MMRFWPLILVSTLILGSFVVWNLTRGVKAPHSRKTQALATSDENPETELKNPTAPTHPQPHSLSQRDAKIDSFDQDFEKYLELQRNLDELRKIDASAAPDEVYVNRLNELIALHPQAPEYLQLLESHYFFHRNWVAAEELTRRLIELDPKHLGYRLELAEILRIQDRNEEGIQVIENSIDLDPQGERLSPKLLRLYQERGREEEGKRWVSENFKLRETSSNP